MPDNGEELIIISDDDDLDDVEDEERGGKQNPMGQMDFIDELETVY
jgi:hypothetical protein